MPAGLDELIANGQQQLEIARQLWEVAPLVCGLFVLAGLIVGWLLGWLFLGAGRIETRIIQSTARQNYSSGYRRGYTDGQIAADSGYARNQTSRRA